MARLLAGVIASPRWSPVADLLLAPLWNRRNAALNDAALGALTLSADDRVLEVGFGGGYLLERMATVATRGLVAGVDVSPGMVRRCRRRFGAALKAGVMDVRCAPAGRLPFGDGAFGKAVSVNSLFYWSDAAAGMRELARVLAPRGRLVICLTCRECLEKRPVGQLVRGWDLEELRSLAVEAGFGIESTERLADRRRQYWRLVLARLPRSEAATVIDDGSRSLALSSNDSGSGQNAASARLAQAGDDEH